MSRSIAGLCHAAHERCEQAKALAGEERRLYLHDAINKLYAAIDLSEEPRPLMRNSRERGSEGIKIVTK